MSGSDAVFLDTTGQPTLGVAVCDRCKTKRPLAELVPDPNAPGLRVCRDPEEGCIDQYDPYRLPTRPPDPIKLPFNRPDQTLETPPQADWTMRDG